MNSGRYPTLVVWNFGYQCNMNCLHCYSRPSIAKHSEIMTVKDAEEIAKSILMANPMQVHLGGGEPLMRPDFFPIVRKIKESGTTVSFSTNGFFLTAAIAEQLKDTIEMVGLSVYGSDEPSHDQFTRCQGSFRALLLAGQYLKTAKVARKLVMVLCSYNAKHASAVMKLASNEGFRSLQFYPMKFVGNAVSKPELRMLPDAWKRLYEELFSQATNYPNLSIDFGLDNDPVVAGYLGKNSLPCPCGKYSVVIRPSGDVSACGLAVIVVGNVHRQSLLDIWQNSPQLRQIRETGLRPCMVISR